MVGWHRSLPRRFAKAGAGLLLAGGMILAAPAIAQETSGGAAEADSSTMPDCLFRVEPASEQGPKTLFGNCRGRGFILGPAEDYQVFRNDELEATIVDLRFGSDRRILMLSLQEDDQVLLEDLSGQIALAGGRGPLSDLAGLEIDIGAFGKDGALAVVSGAEGRPGQATQLNIGQQVAAERTRRLGSATGQ